MARLHDTDHVPVTASFVSPRPSCHIKMRTAVLLSLLHPRPESQSHQPRHPLLAGSATTPLHCSPLAQALHCVTMLPFVLGHCSAQVSTDEVGTRSILTLFRIKSSGHTNPYRTARTSGTARTPTMSVINQEATSGAFRSRDTGVSGRGTEYSSWGPRGAGDDSVQTIG